MDLIQPPGLTLTMDALSETSSGTSACMWATPPVLDIIRGFANLGRQFQPYH